MTLIRIDMFRYMLVEISPISASISKIVCLLFQNINNFF